MADWTYAKLYPIVWFSGSWVLEVIPKSALYDEFPLTGTVTGNTADPDDSQHSQVFFHLVICDGRPDPHL